MAVSSNLLDILYVSDSSDTNFIKCDSSGNLTWSGTGGTTASEVSAIYLTDGAGVYGGADQDWSIVHANTSDMVVTGVLVDVNLTGGLTVDATTISIDGTGASNLSTTAANLTLSTITSGTLAVTSAGALNLTSAAASTWTHSSGNLIFDNTGATGFTYMDCGTDTSATGWGVRNNSGNALITVTADGTVASASRLTTTDGVSSGTARIVGGLAYKQTAASAAVTNTTTETAFDQSYAIPANTLKAGTVVHIRTQGIATATNSTDTLTINVYIGGIAGTALVTTAAVDVADGDVWFADIYLTVRTAGSGGTFVANASYQDPDAAGTTPKWSNVASTAIDTTASQTIVASATWSVASTANSCRQDFLTVEIV